MGISKQFKLYNLNKNWKSLCTDEIKGVKMKKNEKKNVLQLKKTFFIIIIFGCSFGFAFQTWFVELEKVHL
jgi:hypothetical protein